LLLGSSKLISEVSFEVGYDVKGQCSIRTLGKHTMVRDDNAYIHDVIMVFVAMFFSIFKGRLCETEVLKWLKEVPRWQEVAMYLLPEQSAGKDIETIGINNQFQVQLCQIALATQFVHSKTVEVSWKRVHEAFKKAEYTNIAENIQKAYKL